MIRIGTTVGRHTTESSLNDQLKQFKPRLLEDKDNKINLQLTTTKTSKYVNPAHETLQQKCINVLVANFERLPVTEIIPPPQMAEIVKNLPVMPPIIGARYIFNENYWKRCCIERFGWQNCNIEEHGMLWKQTYFEKILQEKLEDFDPLTEDIEELNDLLRACGDHIFTLKFGQLPSHLDLSEVCMLLPNLTCVDIKYGVNKIGMNYERMLFGIKISDCTALAKAIDRTETLTTLKLGGNMIDDDLLRMLMTGLIRNNTITHLDVSHNKITNHGARLLSKLLGDNSVITTLDLSDNAVLTEGGRYLARGLRENDSLLTLNMRLNRLDDDGCRLLFEGLQDNLSLTDLNISSNGAGAGAAQALFSIIRDPEHRLASLDITGNNFVAEHFELLKLSLAHNQTLTGLDMRLNPGYEEATAAVAEIEKIVHTNEFYVRGKLTGNPTRP